MTDEPKPEGRGIVFRCSWCKGEMRLDMGGHSKQDAEIMLHMMTGGWCGKAPFAFKPTSPDDEPNPLVETQLGMSSCCKKQLEGELFGYEESP